MALSKEEISIRIGVDAKAVNAGIGSLNARLSKWAKSQKSFWDESVAYAAEAQKKQTEQAAAELKKREDEELESAVRAAQRSNKARALWRERGAAREARASAKAAEAIAQAEAAASNTFYQRNIAVVGKKFSNFSKGLVAGAAMGGVMAAIDAITRLVDAGIDYASKRYYDLIYGVSENLEKMADKNSSKWKKAREAQKESWDAKKSSNQADRDFKFERSSNLEKLSMLESELNLQMALEKKSKDEMDRQFKKNKLSEDYFKSVTEHSKQHEASLKKQNELRSVLGQLSKEELAAVLRYEYKSAATSLNVAQKNKDKAGISDARAKMIGLRRWIGDIEGKSLEPELAAPLKTPMQKVDDYVSKLKESQDAWKAKTDYSNFGKAIVKAQQEADEDTIQKVAIVEIQDE